MTWISIVAATPTFARSGSPSGSAVLVGPEAAEEHRQSDEKEEAGPEEQDRHQHSHGGERCTRRDIGRDTG